MHFLYTLPRHEQVYLAVAAGAIFALMALWIWARFGRHRYVHLQKTEAIQVLNIQLGRIAESIDHLAVAVESRFPPERVPPPGHAEAPVTTSERRIGMSMMGR